MAKTRVITIDGPAGAGKSTVAGRLASRLNWKLLDTGAMYRSVTLAAIRRGVDLLDEQALDDLTSKIQVRLDSGRILLDGEDVTDQIRAVEVTRQTRHSADCPSVRRRLVDWQRAFAESEGDVVTEGRDQGTIVFPDAFRKYYLMATDEERARRRHSEFVSKGLSLSLQEVLKDMLDRDAQDASRAIAPMKPAEGARIIDSSSLELEQVVALIEDDVLRSRLGMGGLSQD